MAMMNWKYVKIAKDRTGGEISSLPTWDQGGKGVLVVMISKFHVPIGVADSEIMWALCRDPSIRHTDG